MFKQHMHTHSFPIRFVYYTCGRLFTISTSVQLLSGATTLDRRQVAEITEKNRKHITYRFVVFFFWFTVAATWSLCARNHCRKPGDRQSRFQKRKVQKIPLRFLVYWGSVRIEYGGHNAPKSITATVCTYTGYRCIATRPFSTPLYARPHYAFTTDARFNEGRFHDGRTLQRRTLSMGN